MTLNGIGNATIVFYVRMAMSETVARCDHFWLLILAVVSLLRRMTNQFSCLSSELSCILLDSSMHSPIQFDALSDWYTG